MNVRAEAVQAPEGLGNDYHGRLATLEDEQVFLCDHPHDTRAQAEECAREFAGEQGWEVVN